MGADDSPAGRLLLNVSSCQAFFRTFGISKTQHQAQKLFLGEGRDPEYQTRDRYDRCYVDGITYRVDRIII